jgi:CheY-like chemotaxis protein
MAKILIAEDEDSLRRFVARALEMDGHEIAQAGDGADALEQLQSEQFRSAAFRYPDAGHGWHRAGNGNRINLRLICRSC